MKLQKTKGIVLNQFKYSETSLIVNILTEDFGKMSFIINGVRKKKSKFPANYFQSFNILQIVFAQSNKSDLHRITEITIDNLLEDIIFDLHKSSICMFLAEMIHLTHKSSDKDQVLFNFLENIIQFIDSTPSKNIANIHLWTLLRLMQFNGISPENNFSESHLYFNPISGHFTNDKSQNQYIYSAYYSQKISILLRSKIEESHLIELHRTERQELLKLMMQYFQLHLNSFKSSKSLDILSEVFGE